MNAYGLVLPAVVRFPLPLLLPRIAVLAGIIAICIDAKVMPIARFPLILPFSSRILLNLVIVGQCLLWTKNQAEMAQQALLLAVMVTSTPI
jgi:hypothetical protein